MVTRLKTCARLNILLYHWYLVSIVQWVVGGTFLTFGWEIGLLRSLQDSGEPDLDTTSQFLRTTEPKELSNGDKESLLRFMGLPLRLFEKVFIRERERGGECINSHSIMQGSFFQPYLPLQQIDILSSEKTHAYVVGTTNQIFFHQKSDAHIDVLVNVSIHRVLIMAFFLQSFWLRSNQAL